MSTVALTVSGPSATRDLTIPSAVPLALIAPALADEVAPGLPVARLQISTAAGSPIDLDLSAQDAGITDGQVLVMSPREDQPSTAVYDDPAAVVAAQQGATPGDVLARIAAVLGVIGAIALALQAPAGISGYIPVASSLGLAVVLALGRVTAIRSDIVAILATSLALGGLVAWLAQWSLPAAVATIVVAASYLPVVSSSALLRAGPLRIRFSGEHSTDSLLAEGSAARRVSAAHAGIVCGAVLGVGIGAGGLLAWSHLATTLVACCALTSTTARLLISRSPMRRHLLVLLGSATYAGAVVLTPDATATQVSAGAGALVAAVALACVPHPAPTAIRVVGTLETLTRAALGPLLLWVWGALDAVVRLVGAQ